MTATLPTTTTTTTADAAVRYVEPTRADARFNRLVGALVRRGVGLAGARELRVVGRRSGQVRATVVNVLTLDGERYLVAPRGRTEWVRNLRVAGEGSLHLGRREERFVGVEVDDVERKVAVIRAYLERWAWEVGRFLEVVDASSSDAELAAVADGFPVFRIRPTAPAAN